MMCHSDLWMRRPTHHFASVGPVSGHRHSYLAKTVERYVMCVSSNITSIDLDCLMFIHLY